MKERRDQPHWKTIRHEEVRRNEAKKGVTPLASDNLGGRESTFFFTNFPEGWDEKRENQRHETSYADVVKGGNNSKEKIEESHSCSKVKDPVMEDEDVRYEITVIPKSEEEETMKRTLIREVKTHEMLQNIFDMSKVEGLFNIVVRYIGGLFVSLEFEREELADEFLRKAKTSSSNWFHNIFKWYRDFKVCSRLASIAIIGVPLHIWNSKVFDEIARIWGVPVGRSNENNFNKEVRRMGIVTNEEPWIRDVVNVKVNGSCFKVKVVEDSFYSLSMGPKSWEHILDQLTEAEWTEGEDDDLGGDALAEGEENLINSGMPNDIEENRRVPLHDNSKKKSLLERWTCRRSQAQVWRRAGSLLRRTMERRLFRILITRHKTLVFFPFVDSEDNMDEDLDIGDEEDIEQAISDAIDRKIRHRKKGSRKSQSKGISKGDSERSNRSGNVSSSSFHDEVNQTIRIGEELGVQFKGNRVMVEQVIHREGAAGIKW
ncbi:hypothetical protein L2E82_08010 [Cichorium intybus]|uniref:Uncharacterized protein n=1 Tax=Cichorium intybus TaxID=13427 RepID=A0ACB9G4U3_CICIN|nr:hypothetical protein L2E82_08010 [Cichorium intybus]